MSFLGKLVNEFTHSGQSGQGQQQYQQHSSGAPTHAPPPVSPPWHVEWDARDNRWLFVNQQTGERTFTYPGPGYGQQQGGYPDPQGGYGNTQGGYSYQGAYGQGSYKQGLPNNSYQQQEHQKKQGGNGWKYAAAGAAGVAGGALLMHEGHEISKLVIKGIARYGTNMNYRG